MLFLPCCTCDSPHRKHCTSWCNLKHVSMTACAWEIALIAGQRLLCCCQKKNRSISLACIKLIWYFPLLPKHSVSIFLSFPQTSAWVNACFCKLLCTWEQGYPQPLRCLLPPTRTPSQTWSKDVLRATANTLSRELFKQPRGNTRENGKVSIFLGLGSTFWATLREAVRRRRTQCPSFLGEILEAKL